MTLGSLAAFVAGKIGLTDATTLAKIKGFAAERYSAIYEGALWKDALSVYSRSIAVGQKDVILPYHIAQFVAAKFASNRLVPVDASFLFNSDPDLWDRLGTPTHCSELPPIATEVLPTGIYGALKLVATSSEASDAGQVIHAHGEDIAGNPLSTAMTLIGLSPVLSSAPNFAVIYGLSKGVTAGQILIQGVDGTLADPLNTLVRLSPSETQRLYRRVRLHSTPTAAITLAILGKRHAWPLVNDNDSPTLPSLCTQGLQAMVHGDALEMMRQYGKAQAKYAEGLALVEQAKKTEMYQAAQTQRLLPGDGIAEGCSSSDFL